MRPFVVSPSGHQVGFFVSVLRPFVEKNYIYVSDTIRMRNMADAMVAAKACRRRREGSLTLGNAAYVTISFVISMK